MSHQSPNYYPEFSNLLVGYLEEQSRSQSWLAKRLGINPGTVSRWITQHTRPDSPETIIRIADLLGVYSQEERQRLLAAVGYGVAPRNNNNTVSLLGEEELSVEGRGNVPDRLLSSTNVANNELPENQAPFGKIFQVPHPYNHEFTGRETYLTTLERRLQWRSDSGLTQAQAIHGLGGVGKTQLALKYAYDHQTQYQLVWWLRSEEAATLAADFIALAAELDLPQRNIPDQTIVIAAVKAWLAQTNEWLLIFDNAPNQVQVDPYLLQTGHTIITTRNHYWENVGTLSLEIMTPNEAILFFKKNISQTAETEADALALADALGYLPLALAQAAAYIKKHQRTVASYLTLFEKHRTVLLARDFGSKAYPATVATTWELAFEQIQEANPQALDILCLFAYFVPDNIQLAFLANIIQELPKALAEMVSDELELDETLSLLQQYGLIKREGDQISIHRLVQLVTREKLKAVTLEITLEEIAALLSQIRDYLISQAQDAEAQAYGELALEINEAVLGPEHPKTAHSLNQLGLALRRQGAYETAKLLFERALAINEKQLGPDSPETALSLKLLGWLLFRQGEPEQAKPLLERALAINEKVLGPNEHQTADSLDLLAWLAYDQGSYEVSKSLHEQALAINESVFGSDRLEISVSLNNVAVSLIALGAYESAKPLLERALAINEKLFGPDHPNTAHNLHNLARLLSNQGAYKAAESLIDRVLQIRENALGDGHPYTAESLQLKATILERQRNLPKATLFYERALAIRAKVLGPDHPDTKAVRENLASLKGD